MQDRKDNRFIFISPAFETIWGMPRQKVYDNPYAFLDHVHPEDLDDISAAIKLELEDETFVNTEYRIIRPDGEIRWIWARNFPVKNKSGEVYRVAGIAEDITHRKEAEMKIQARETSFREFFENESNYCYMISPDGIILDLNSSAVEGLKYDSKDELVGKPVISTIYSPYCREKAQNLFNEWKITGKLKNEKLKILTKKGEEKDVILNVSSVYDSNGELLHTISIQTDISEKKRFKEILEETEEKYRLLIKNADEAIVLLNLTGKIVDVNPKALEISGFKREEVIGTNFIKLLPDIKMDIKQVLSVFKDLVRGKSGKEQYWIMENKKGKQIHFIAHYSILQKKGKILGISCIIEDVTEQMKIEDELKESLEEKEVLLSEIHHRVKNNMQIISSLLNLQSSFLDDEKLADIFLESQNRVKSMAMVHEKLYQSDDLAKIVAIDYIKTLVNDLSTSYQIKPDQIKTNLDIGKIKFDIDTAIPIGLLINEITTNSFKHAFPDNKKGQITIKLQKNEDDLNLIISDNGVGIPANIDPTNTTTLGLQLVTNLVKQLEGTMNIKRENGTEFDIKFKETS